MNAAVTNVSSDSIHHQRPQRVEDGLSSTKPQSPIQPSNLPSSYPHPHPMLPSHSDGLHVRAMQVAKRIPFEDNPITYSTLVSLTFQLNCSVFQSSTIVPCASSERTIWPFWNTLNQRAQCLKNQANWSPPPTEITIWLKSPKVWEGSWWEWSLSLECICIWAILIREYTQRGSLMEELGLKRRGKEA